MDHLSLWGLWNFYKMLCSPATSKGRVENFPGLSERDGTQKPYELFILKGSPKREIEWLSRTSFWFSPRVAITFTVFRVSLQGLFNPFLLCLPRARMKGRAENHCKTWSQKMTHRHYTRERTMQNRIRYIFQDNACSGSAMPEVDLSHLKFEFR